MNYRIDVPRLLSALGIEATYERDKWRASCPDPSHPHPTGKVSTPSWSIRDDDNAGSHYCFGCGFKGGPWELVAAVRGLTLEEAGEWVRRELAGNREAEMADVPIVRVELPRTKPREMVLPYGVQIPSVDGSRWFEPAYDYLTRPLPPPGVKMGPGHGRGVPDWQMERWHIGYSIKARLAHRVVVPVYTRGRLLAYVARAYVDDGRNRYDVASKKTDMGARPEVALFGEPGFEPDVDVATVSEGVFKMLAFERVGAPNPCAILGASNLGPEKVDMLSRFRLLLVGTDPDDAGNLAFEKIHDALCRWTEVRRIPLVRAPDDAQDDENRAAWRAALLRRRKAWPTAPLPSGA